MICYINQGVELGTPLFKTSRYEVKRVDDNQFTEFIQANIQQASVIKDFRRVYIMILKAESAGKRFCLFCASSYERRHGKFTVVLARAVNFIWVLEERRDNARMKFWHMSCSRSNEPCKLECACTNSSLYGECP